MGNFTFGGADVVKLAREFGTPLYVMSEDEMTRRLREIKSCFDEKYERCRSHFAAKAFLTRDVLRLLSRENLGLDVVSGGELYLAREMKFPAEKIAFHGNSETRAEISDGLLYGVGKFVCDSVDEINFIDALAGEAGRRADILIRLNPGVEAHTHSHMLTSGGRTKFGLSPDAILGALFGDGGFALAYSHERSPASASYFSMEIFSSSLYCFIRFMKSFQSTLWPSNSGPSTQPNFISSPTERRQQPHMPVPSTIIGFIETQIGRPSSAAASVQNFIIMLGPIAQTRSTLSPRATTIFIASVTRPFMPSEPSSVVIISSSENSSHSPFMITRSDVRPPRIVTTLFPACFKPRTMG